MDDMSDITDEIDDYEDMFKVVGNNKDDTKLEDMTMKNMTVPDGQSSKSESQESLSNNSRIGAGRQKYFTI